MGYIPNKTRKGTGSKRSHLLPGRYNAVITDVSQAEGYVPGEAFTVKYMLTVGDSTLVYKETFIDRLDEDRTVKFLDFLEDNGYDREDLSDIIGLKLELELLKEKKGSGIFLNVYRRFYIGHQGDNT